MPYLKKIVDFINTELSNSLLNTRRFQDKKIIGIAQAMPRKEKNDIQLLPSYVDNNGEGQYVGVDDDYSLIIYHKVNSVTVGKTASGGRYGDGTGYDAHVAKMSMVVFGRRDRLELTNDELAIYLQANVPDAVDAPLLKALQFKVANININDIVLNDLQVFQEEYQGFTYFLKPEQFLFKLNYSIESAFLKKCFANCS